MADRIYRTKEDADEIERLRTELSVEKEGHDYAVRELHGSETRITELTAALEYYANRIHWMGETENSEFQTVFLAAKGWDMNGWKVAEDALARWKGEDNGRG